MKVAINLTVEIDPAEWNAEYATDDTSTEIRKMIRSDMLQAVSDALAYLPHTVKENY